jgi:hypothetical protein
MASVSVTIAELENQMQSLLLGLKKEHSELKNYLAIQLEKEMKVCLLTILSFF